MIECSLHIKRGAVYKINVPATTGSVVSSATVWTLYDDREQTLNSVLSAGSELILGPYVNISKFRIQITGDATIEEVGDNFGVPIPLFAHQDMDLGTFGLTATTLDINLPADDSINIDGSTNPREITTGAYRQTHTPAIPGTRAFNIAIDMNNQPETKQSNCKTGDIWQLGDHRLYCGDSMEVPEELFDSKIRMI